MRTSGQGLKLMVDAGLSRHPKLRSLARALGVDRQAMVGKLFDLWSWVMDWHENGDITGAPATLIAEEIGWTGDPKALWSALTTPRDGFGPWIDTSACTNEHDLNGGPHVCTHDWMEHQGPLIRERERKRRERAEERARKASDPVRDAMHEAFVTPPEGSVAHCLLVAKQVKLIGHPASIRNHVEGWHARLGASATEKLILDNAGRDVKEIQLGLSRREQSDDSGAAALLAKADAMRRKEKKA